MKPYKEHLLSIKSFGENTVGRQSKPVYRTSAIFPVVNNSSVQTRILFMGYWLVKKNITQLGFLVSMRSATGELIYRENSELTSPKAVEIRIQDLLGKIGFGDDEFVGSIELEVFSSIDLVFPFPAFVVNYYNQFGSGVVHTTGRIYNDFEDLKANESIKVKEAGFDLLPSDKYAPFFAFVNGFTELHDAVLDVEIIKENGEVYLGELNLGNIAPLQTLFVQLKEYLPIDDFLGGEIGTIKIKHDLTGFFPRFVAGNICTDNDAISVTHTYYDNAENKEDSAYHRNENSEILLDSSIFFPLFLDGDFYTELKLYPIYSPSNHTISFEFYDDQGQVVGELKDYLTITSDKSSFVSLDFKKCIEEANFDITRIKGVRLFKDWVDKNRIPTRLKYGLNVGKKNRVYDSPTNICFGSELSNMKILNKNQTFKWMPLVNAGESVITIQNSSYVRDYSRPANITVSIFNTSSDEPLTRNYTIPAHGQVKISMDDELKYFLDDKSGWVTVKSDNPFTKAWYFDFNESGIMGGDHSF